MDEIQLSAVQEAMNQMMGSAATSMSTIFSKKVDISPPSIDLLDVQQGEGTDKIPDDDIFVKVSFRLKIGDLIDSNIMQLLPLHFAKSLVEELLNPKPEIEKNDSIGMETIPENQYVENLRVPIIRWNIRILVRQWMNRFFNKMQQQQAYTQESYPYENIPYQNQMPLQGMKEYHSEPQHLVHLSHKGFNRMCSLLCFRILNRINFKSLKQEI